MFSVAYLYIRFSAIVYVARKLQVKLDIGHISIL